MEKNSALRADNKKLSHILVSKTSSPHFGNAPFRLAALAITVSGLLFCLTDTHRSRNGNDC
ncbi:hypothetical protein PJ912_26560 [Pectobacterium colocasium]|uniref:hypothetical protein n=1 Tax=Pectobacterium colocasium TaxID=2878098 RepID=UPI003D75ECE6